MNDYTKLANVGRATEHANISASEGNIPELLSRKAALDAALLSIKTKKLNTTRELLINAVHHYAEREKNLFPMGPYPPVWLEEAHTELDLMSHANGIVIAEGRRKVEYENLGIPPLKNILG